MSELPRGAASLPAEATAFLQRARILDATARVVAARGYDRATVREIQSRAGVSRRTFYDRFGGKEDAVVEAYAAAAAYALPRVLRAFRSEPGWTAGIDAALTVCLALMDCDRDWAALCVAGLPAAGPRALARREAVMRPLLTELAPGPEPVSAAGLAAAVEGVLRARVGGTAPLSDAREEVLQIALSPFTGVEDVERRARAVTVAGSAPSRAPEIARLFARAAPEDVLRHALTVAVAERDGAALWRATLCLHDRRIAGLAVPAELERLVLGGLRDAAFFGLPLDAISRGEPGPWAVPTAEQRCLRYVHAHPGAGARAVQAHAGAGHRSTVNRALARLAADGLLARTGDRGWRCTPAGDAAARALG